MKTERFVYRTHIPAPAPEVFAWHVRPGAFERLAPPWAPVEVVERTGGIEHGARVVLRISLGPVSRLWVAEHRDVEAGRQFRDVQLQGPFAYWEHTHRVEPDGPTACYLEDEITYALPCGMVGRLIGTTFVHRQLQRLFAYRHQVIAHDIVQHRTRSAEGAMRIVVTGASGLIGSALVPFLTTGGHQVTRLVRSQPRPGAAEVQWDPLAGRLEATALEGVDAVVHLAGENVAAGRWTAARKAAIRDSRVRGTQVLCDALARLSRPPRVVVSASAIGYYGDRGDELLREDSAPGAGFLAEVCRAWEAATQPAVQKGIRVVLLRFGVVLSPAGGALAKMLLPFKIGLGGVVGSGKQYMSWIGIDDAVGAIHHVLHTEALQGPVNVVAPHPVTNAEFTATLARVLRRPALVPLPAVAARLVFGEMADALLLASARVEPTRLLATAYSFRHATLEDALRHVLGMPS
ncbi:MAG: TIGR01777 family oxidoreductase [Candidatus Binatia bacterium]|nr:TIGR01777 family oxidoreductase [Candidatus Binatia bacterium]